MDFSYLPKRIHFFWPFFLLLFYVWGPNLFLVALLISYLVLLILFRKSRLVIHEDSSVPDGFVLSPSNGKVLAIRRGVFHETFGQDLTELRISLSWFSEVGLSFPVTGEVESYKLRKGVSFLRLGRKKLEDENRPLLHAKLLAIKGKNGEDIGMEFLKCELGLESELWVRPGDKGKRKARLGYFPFGGTILVYFSGDYEILAGQGEKLVRGETPLAGKFY